MKLVITEDKLKNLFNESCYNDLINGSESEAYRLIGILAQNGYAVHGNKGVEWQEFDPNRIERVRLGWGAYFTKMAYKGIEFGLGGNFMIADMKDMKLIDFDETLTPEVIKAIMWSYRLPIQIEKIRYQQDMCRNTREYDACEAEIKELTDKLSRNSLKIAYYAGNAINNGAKRPSDITSFLIQNNFTEKDISKYFLELGFDGFCEGNAQISIFNFNKLNKAIVKDKDKLIRDLTEDK